MKLVIDTSILIDYLRGGEKWEEIIKQVKDEGEFFLPTIVIFELFSGQSTNDPEIVKKIMDIIRFCQKVDLSEEIAKRAGQIYRDVTKTIDVPDYIIAATALEIGATVITINKKHFQQIPKLSIYT